ncbi:caspase domain-containing protein [Xylaria venustula]|nr:caspase domain-containing protein [Xylaria venustula]
MTRYALLIGINYYPKTETGQWRPLRGSVEDAQEMKEHLTRLCTGDNQVDIEILTASIKDSDASRPVENMEVLPTHSKVISSLEAITSKASAGDFVYIHFSGHGTAVKYDSEFSNSSTGDLALVLLASDDITKIHYLRGSELAYQLQQMAKKNINVTIVLDCCTSGGVLRNKLGPSVRYLPYDPVVDMAYPPIPNRSLSPEEGAMRPADRNASMNLNWLVNPERYTILTACEPTESAQELQSNGKSHGALSFFLMRAFNKCGGVGGRKQHIYAHLCAIFKESYPQQTPMLYGNRNIGFFDDATDKLGSVSIPVVMELDRSFRLQAGRAHGIHNGDRFVLLASNGTEWHSKFTGARTVVEVTGVGALKSTLQLPGGIHVSKASGLTATALTHLSLRRFPIRVRVGLLDPNEWATALQRRVSLDAQFATEAKHDTPFSFYVAIVAKDRYEIQDESGQEIPNLPNSPYNLEQDADYVLDIVEHLAKFKMVKGLTNSSPSQLFTKSFSIHLVKACGKVFEPGCVQLGHFHTECAHSQCLVEVEHDDVVSLVVKNKEEAVQIKKQDADRSLYCHLYSMGSSWEIESLLAANHVVIPPRFSNKSDDFPEGTDGEWRKRIQMTVPQGQHQCDDIFKVFLTRQSTSFSSLELPELGKPAESHGNNKCGELDSAGLSEEWIAVSFRVRTRKNRL